MEDQFDEFIKVLEALEEHEVDYVLIGGVAVILHGMQRLTRDVDIFVKIVPENIDKLRSKRRNPFQLAENDFTIY